MSHKTLFSPTRGNHIAKIEQFYNDHPEVCGPDKCPEILVSHDEWCSIHWNDVCNCDPDIKLSEGDVADKGIHSSDMVLIDHNG